MAVTLRENQRVYYYEQLDKLFPGLKQKYINTYGNSYQCMVPNYKKLYTTFTSECNKYGILYNMQDIINAYKKQKTTQEQISLF